MHGSTTINTFILLQNILQISYGKSQFSSEGQQEGGAPVTCQVCITTSTQLHRSTQWSYKNVTSHLQYNHPARMLPIQYPRGNAHLSWKFPKVTRQSSHNPAQAHCFFACSGINFATVSAGTPFSSVEKQNGERNKVLIFTAKNNKLATYRDLNNYSAYFSKLVTKLTNNW